MGNELPTQETSRGDTAGLPPEPTLDEQHAGVRGGGAAAGGLEEPPAEQVGVADEQVGPRGEVEVRDRVELVADVAAGRPGRVAAGGVPGRVVQRVVRVRQPEV